MKKKKFMMTRRQVLKAGMIGGAGLMLPLRFLPAKAFASTDGQACTLFDPQCSNLMLSNPRDQAPYFFTEDVPNALDPGFIYQPDNKGRYKVKVGPAIQQTGLRDGSGTMLSTPVWGYAAQKDRVFSWPGKTFEVKSGNSETSVTWANALNGISQHLLPVDTSLHWCYSLHGASSANGVDYRQFSIAQNGVPIVTHVHGGHTDFQFDGNPEFFYNPDENVVGPQWSFVPDGFTTRFRYDNNVPAGNLWYHDHALGLTRLNVYAGMAGFYFVRDDEDPGLLFNSSDRNLPKFPYEMALAIQDRMFKNTGELFYPAFPGDPYWFDFITDQGLADDEVPQPSALAEFFGDHMVVNGKIWPKADVARATYRLRLLNGCDSRFMVIQFIAVNAGVTDPNDTSAGSPLTFKVIGSDQGLGAPEDVDTLVFEPGGRYDILIDFSDLALSGKRVIMKNLGGDEPFGGAIGEEPIFEYTDRVMAFDVGTGSVVDQGTIDLIGLGAHTVPTTTIKRKVALFEGTDEFGRLQPLLGVVEPGSSLNAYGSRATPYTWFQPTTETPALDSTEEWEIYNFTGDAHPIHLHLVNFQILGRNQISFDSDDGDPGQPVIQHNGLEGRAPIITDLNVGPSADKTPTDGYVENAPKDMVTALPEEVTKIRATFDKSGRYVWHCHILSHEDHEMMRVLQVG